MSRRSFFRISARSAAAPPQEAMLLDHFSARDLSPNRLHHHQRTPSAAAIVPNDTHGEICPASWATIKIPTSDVTTIDNLAEIFLRNTAPRIPRQPTPNTSISGPRCANQVSANNPNDAPIAKPSTPSRDRNHRGGKVVIPRPQDIRPPGEAAEGHKSLRTHLLPILPREHKSVLIDRARSDWGK